MGCIGEWDTVFNLLFGLKEMFCRYKNRPEAVGLIGNSEPAASIQLPTKTEAAV